jgi:hypothetical protein
MRREVWVMISAVVSLSSSAAWAEDPSVSTVPRADRPPPVLEHRSVPLMWTGFGITVTGLGTGVAGGIARVGGLVLGGVAGVLMGTPLMIAGEQKIAPGQASAAPTVFVGAGSATVRWSF